MNFIALKVKDKILDKKVINLSSFLQQLYLETNGMHINITKKILSNFNFLKLVYGLIENKKNNAFADSKKLTKEWFKKTSLVIKNDALKFNNKRNIYVSKKNSNSKIFIVLNSWREQIVQKAVYLILEEIYKNKDTTFAEFSYTFYLNKNLHNVFWIMKHKWISTSWFVKICVKNTFGSKNYDILIDRLKLKIKDRRLNNVILRMLKANVISISRILKENVNISQSNILSQILTNIYFQGLDREIKKKFIIKYNLSKKATKFGFYFNIFQSGITRVNYIRYEDDILVGVQDFKFLAINILNMLIKYLKLNLWLFLDKKKSQILNLFSNKIPFLGMLVNNIYFKNSGMREIGNKKRAYVRHISGVNVSKQKQLKNFKKELSHFVQKIVNKSSNNWNAQKDYNSLVESLQIFMPNSFFYGNFWKNLQEIVVVKQNWKLCSLVKFFEKEYANFKGNLFNKTLETSTKNMIKKILLFLNTNYDLQVCIVKWSQLFRGINQTQVIFKLIWLENFELFKATFFRLKELCEKKLTKWINEEVICLITKDLFNKTKELGIKNEVTILSLKILENTRWNLNTTSARIKLSIKINANINEIYKYLMKVSIINKKKKPISKAFILKLKPFFIINYFKKVANGLLFYFRCADNFYIVQKIIVCYIRYSLLRTLAQKHKCSLTAILFFYGEKIKALNIISFSVLFLSPAKVLNLQKAFCKKV